MVVTGQFLAVEFGWAMGKSPGRHCVGSSPSELAMVVRAGLEKYHSPSIRTLVAAGAQ
jgi:hypothetical protein